MRPRMSDTRKKMTSAATDRPHLREVAALGRTPARVGDGAGSIFPDRIARIERDQMDRMAEMQRRSTTEPSARTTVTRPWRRPSSTAGFTFLELVLVVVVIGLLFSISIISLRGMGPKYRLRSAARLLASDIERTRLSAISRQQWLGIRYVIDPQGNKTVPYYQVIPPPPEDYPDQPLEERQLHSPQELPTTVRFREIRLANGQTASGGDVSILFAPQGNTGSHIVVLEGAEDRVMAIKVNSITGLTDFYETDLADFQHFEG